MWPLLCLGAKCSTFPGPVILVGDIESFVKNAILPVSVVRMVAVVTFREGEARLVAIAR